MYKSQQHLNFFSCVKIAGDLLDLVGDGAFEMVQDLIMVRQWLICFLTLMNISASQYIPLIIQLIVALYFFFEIWDFQI